MHEIKHMQTFCAVVECGGFSGAQTTLGMSQPAISKHIRDFEIRLGFRLCYRGRGGFFLTERGKLAYRECREMLNVWADFDTKLGALRGKLSGQLRIGLIDTTVTHTANPLSAALNRFNQRDNEVTLNLEVFTPTELHSSLLNGNIHIAIGLFPTQHKGVDYYDLYQEAHHFYCGKQHPLFEVADRITLDDLYNYTVSSRAYLQQTDLSIFSRKNLAATVSNMEAQALLINSGCFMGFLPSHYAKQWVDRGEMRALIPLELNWQSGFQLAVRNTPPPGYMVSCFIEDLLAVRDSFTTRRL